jgi:hypothetical protein
VATRSVSDLRRPGAFAAVVESLLSDGVSVRFRAGGRSMSPAIEDGETIVVAPVGDERVTIGDVIYGDGPRGPIAHRVIAIDRAADGEPRFTLSGDAAVEHDRPLSSYAVRGKVLGVERHGELVSLAVAGGQLGRRALVATLELRRSLRSFGRVVIAAVLAPINARL